MAGFLLTAKPEGRCSFKVFQYHNPDMVTGFPKEDDMREGGHLAAPEPPLSLIEWEMSRSLSDGGYRQSKLGFESVGYLQSAFGFVIIESLIEVLLDQWMITDGGAHAWWRRRTMPLQNSDSSSNGAFPEFNSFSRRQASSRRSLAEDSGTTLRRSSTANFRRERCGSFKARS